MYDFKNKAKNLTQNNNYLLAKTLSMFEWEGLPDTLPSKELEKLLQVNGFAFITEVNGEIFAFNGGLGGLQDVYSNPTTITINNVALGFNATLDLKTDGVLICNDDFKMGMMPLFNKYNTMLIENDISLMMHGYNSRLQTFISAGDDKTRESAELFLERLIKGELGVIGESALFDGIKAHSTNSNSNSITSLVEFHQYLKGSLFNEIGLSSNFNMKRERLTEGEVEAVEDTLYPFVGNMMKNRQLALLEINAKYGLEIDIDYGSVWFKKNKELVNNIVETEEEKAEWETTTETTETPAPESLDESLLESLDESLDESEADSLEPLEDVVEPEELEPEELEPEELEPEVLEFISEDEEINPEYLEVLEKLKSGGEK